MGKKYYKWAGTRTTDEEFISALARELGETPQRAKEIIKTFVSVVRDVTELNTFLSIRRLGVFTIRKRKNSKYTNRTTGTTETLPLINIVHFKPSQSWRNEINAKTKKIVLEKIETAKRLALDSFVM